jgi:hypothetical protein
VFDAVPTSTSGVVVVVVAAAAVVVVVAADAADDAADDGVASVDHESGHRRVAAKAYDEQAVLLREVGIQEDRSSVAAVEREPVAAALGQQRGKWNYRQKKVYEVYEIDRQKKNVNHCRF